MKNQNFTRLLENVHNWPCQYLFKFVVPAAKLSELCSLLEEKVSKDGLKIRHSKKQNYTSISFELDCRNSHDVLSLYEKVSCIEGVVIL